MSLFGAILVVALFFVLLYALKLVRQASEVVTVARRSAELMRNPSISDDEKEKAIQQASMRLFVLMLWLLFGFSVALAAPVGVVWLLEQAGVMALGDVLAVLVRWDFIVVASIVCVAAYVVVEKLRR